MKKIITNHDMYNVYLLNMNKDIEICQLLVTDGNDEFELPMCIISVDMKCKKGIYNFQTLNEYVFNNHKYIMQSVKDAIIELGGEFDYDI